MTLLAGRYEIIRELGKGSFAVTYLAKDHHIPSHPLCVVKQLHTIHKNNQSVLKLFEKEAIALEKLGKHPQIPTLLAYFPQDDNYYISQEYIAGNDLSKEIAHGKRWSEDNVIQLLKEVLEILVFVHTHAEGVIHRDIKPKNLMRRQPDGKIFLIDFGSVKELGSIILNPQGGSTVAGSPGFMPSEQFNGKPCYASDIYALGMTAIYALTGIDPIKLEEDDYAEKIWRYSNLQVSDYLAEYLTTMIRRKADKRYPSAVEALEALKPLLEPPTGTIVFSPAKTAYCNEVIKRLKEGNGQLSVVAKQLLEKERQRLALSVADAKEMYDYAIAQVRDYQTRLREYEDLLIKVVQEQFPFDQKTEAQLEEFRNSLGLKAEDVAKGETISTDLANYQGTHWKIGDTVYPGNYGQGQKGEFREKTTEVGIFTANPCGLYDMCGNVWEWCEDEWHENYINAPSDGSAWSDGKNEYIALRGGSWDGDPRHCRSASRYFSNPDFRYDVSGFRLVVSGARTL